MISIKSTTMIKFEELCRVWVCCIDVNITKSFDINDVWVYKVNANKKKIKNIPGNYWIRSFMEFIAKRLRFLHTFLLVK